eukprot:TRINITY_DN157_c1_g2_i4.p1 TRINITY_DN157_c1_g2~~TRINITY_DN157_c1_g2_i4.p1  ORF type:complete len:108 (+),score=4.53 TRINITY_DN157_c1_g2_i4:211-534(+)
MSQSAPSLSAERVALSGQLHPGVMRGPLAQRRLGRSQMSQNGTRSGFRTLAAALQLREVDVERNELQQHRRPVLLPTSDSTSHFKPCAFRTAVRFFSHVTRSSKNET